MKKKKNLHHCDNDDEVLVVEWEKLVSGLKDDTFCFGAQSSKVSLASESHVAMLMGDRYERERMKMQKEKKPQPLYKFLSRFRQCLRSIFESHTPPALQRQPDGSARNYTGSRLQPCDAAHSGWRQGIGEVPRNQEFTLAVGM